MMTKQPQPLLKKLKSPDLLSKSEIEELLPVADLILDWVNQLKAFALKEALNGVKFKGFKLVEGRSNRQFTDTAKVETILLANGYKEDDIYRKDLQTMTALEKLVGKKKFNALLGEVIIKPPGRPTLVSVSDPRPEYSALSSAAADFQEPID